MNKIIVFITCSMLCFSAFSCGDIEAKNEKLPRKVLTKCLTAAFFLNMKQTRNL